MKKTLYKKIEPDDFIDLGPFFIICSIDFIFITVLTVNNSRQTMAQHVMVTKPPRTETVCCTCKHFIESEGLLYCKFFDAFFNAEILCVPCEFKEESDSPVFLE